ncbi:T7SS effector LXG polymorphic toxin [Virgibacillus sp. MSJ-26]|uniref:T7SS effector LXG polymorphic toxin n=1 Tax=Virgibacillus sp. MSJ-26 TaxID=2841522 RepID=UPI0035302CF4
MLDVSSLQDGIDFTVQDIESKRDQIQALQKSVHGFHTLEDALRGQGGEAIRAFYRDAHEPFLVLFHQFLIDYSNLLKDMKEAVGTFESNSSGYVNQEFLETDVDEGFAKVEKTATELTDDANEILADVEEIVSVKRIDESEVVEDVQRGKEKAKEIVEELTILDEYEAGRLEETKQALHELRSFISGMESMFKSGDLSIRNYNVEMLEGMPAYNDIMDRINNKDRTTISARYGEDIEKMPLSEIEKMKDELSTKLDKNGQEFLNSVYADLENGEIDRETFKIIMQELNGTELSEMDNDSRAYIEAVYQDYKNEEVDNNTFTTVFSGVVSTGASFIKDFLKSKAKGEVIDAAVKGAEEWIKKTTDIFLNLGPVASEAGTGANISLTLTDRFKDQVRNVVNFGAKHGPTFIGAALDSGAQVYSGEDVEHATIKAIGHIGTANVGRIAGTAIVGTVATALGVSGGLIPIVAVGAGFVLGSLAAKGFDMVYDKWGREVVDGVVDIGKNVTENIGDAVTGFFGSLKSAFS